MRLFRSQVDDQGQPILLKGEKESAVLHDATMHFDGSIGGVEGHLSDRYTDGFAVITNYRIIWASYQPAETAFDGVPCHFPLSSISESELSRAFLQLKPAKIHIYIRLDAAGYPSSDALTVSKVIKIELNSQKPSAHSDVWYRALQTAMTKQSWKFAPQGLLEMMHTPPPGSNMSKVKAGPLTPPSKMVSSMIASSTRSSCTVPNTTMPSPRPLVSDINENFQSITHIKRAIDVDMLRHSENIGTTEALGPLGMQSSSMMMTINPFGSVSIQRRQEEQMMISSGIGLAGVLERQKQRVAATDKILDGSFTDLQGLMSKAEELVRLAEAFRARAIRIAKIDSAASKVDDEAIEMDNTLASELADLGIASPITRESCGKLYYSELARQVSEVMGRPVKENGGVMSLPEVYRIFCRARFTDLISPDDLLQAAKRLLEVPGSQLRFKSYPSGIKALVSADSDNDKNTWKQIVKLAEIGKILSTRTEKSSPAIGVHKYGGGITIPEVAEMLSIPLSLANQHVISAEAAGLLCRDDGPEGLRYYKNIFNETLLVSTAV